MRNLQEIYKECVQECKDAYIPIRDDKVISIEVENKDEVGYYGACDITHSDNNLIFNIYINSLFLDEDCPLIELKDTIIHELIHTCPRCGIHGKTWMKYAKIMNEKYGYELTTSKDNDEIFHKDKPILHKYVCPKCESIANFRTEHPECDEPNTYVICPFCRSHYKKIF